MLETRGRRGLLNEKVGSSSRVPIKDSVPTKGVANETSPFLAVKVSFKVRYPLISRVSEWGLQVRVGSFLEKWLVVKPIPF